MTPSTLRTLLAGALDYAGLFPPAALPLDAAVAEDARARRSPQAWLVGRFVVGAARLEALATLVAASGPGAPLPLSVVVADPAEAAALSAAGDPARLRLEAVEVPAKTPAEVARAAALRDGSTELEVFVEVPSTEPEPYLDACLRHGVMAKVRTGGVEPAAFFSAARLARFLAACAARDLPFKATAGLHHALAGDYPLTYEPGAACARMHGFLPLFAGAALLAAGRLDEGGLADFLATAGDSSFHIRDGVLAVGGAPLDHETAAAGRRLLRSFGSCSFQEPVDDLARLALLT